MTVLHGQPEVAQLDVVHVPDEVAARVRAAVVPQPGGAVELAEVGHHRQLGERDMTPTGKVRRKQVTRRYRRLLDAFYVDSF